MSSKIVTVRDALQKKCRGRATDDVTVNRRAFRHLVETVIAAEEQRNAYGAQALLLHEQAGRHVTNEEWLDAARRMRAAQTTLDRLLEVLDVPA